MVTTLAPAVKPVSSLIRSMTAAKLWSPISTALQPIT